MKKNKAPHVLLVHIYTTSQGDYKHLEAREFWLDEERAADRLSDRNYNAMANFEPRQYVQTDRRNYYIDGLTLTSQANRESGCFTAFYAFDTSLNEHVSLRKLDDAMENVKRLQLIERKYGKLCNDFGRPQTMSDYINYIAKCIDATLAVYDEDTRCVRSIEIETLRYMESKAIQKA